MQYYLLFTGKNASGSKFRAELEEDLIGLTREHGCRLIMSSEIVQPSSSGILRQTMKLYEILSRGAINVQVSSQRDIEVVDKKCDGLVMCLGFDESAEYFQELHNQLKQLCSVYSSDRF